jgi:hypothetical protein
MINIQNENQKLRARKRKWTQEEDQLLCQGYDIYGAKDWENISKYVKSRNGKQCRERYLSQFAPGLSLVVWSKAEDDILIDQQKIYGNKWKVISTFLPGRSFIDVKNRWCKFQRNLMKIPSKIKEEVKDDENEENRWLDIQSIFDENDKKSFYYFITDRIVMFGEDHRY